ncbi:MAG: transaldolase family protein [Tropicimonas sp.]|uniref:transaldolase family protein n=1 Tax=Tropicimonas sp. TaxID=2067044 RepID=UPI003A845847
MKLYLDTADAKQIERHLATGLFSGVTCNPVILKAAGLTPDTAHVLYNQATAAGAEQVFLQTFGATFEDQLAQGLRYRELGPEVVVKVVCTGTGLAVARRLESQGVTTLLTAIHDAKQTLSAMAAGATYVAPYLSEMYASGRDGIAQVLSMLKMLKAEHSRTTLVMAGFHDIPTMVTLAEAGMEYLTITPAIADTLFAQPETEAMAAFFDQASGV